MVKITNNLRRFRKELGLRQEDLASLADVTRQTIIAIESERYNPSLELAMKLSKILNKSIEEIFQFDNS